MKEFVSIRFDPAQCRRELVAFKGLLDGKTELEEGADIKPFFDANRNLAALLGSYHWNVLRFGLLAFQYQLFGDFACDLVVGDPANNAFGFIEFEDAGTTSLFRRQGEKATPEWGTRLERAFSQVVDWFWKLDDMARTDEFEARFGCRHIDYFGLLVAGRDEWLAHSRESRRWEWRSRKILVNGYSVRCATYDQLYRFLEAKLDSLYPLKDLMAEKPSPPAG